MRHLTTLALLLTSSIVIGIIESFIPSFIPGLKLGLANIVTLIIIYKYNNSDALVVLLLRIFLVAVLTGRFMSVTFYMSLTGGIFAYIGMILFKRLNFYILTTSVIGAILHVIGQILIASIVLSSIGVIWYLPILLICSILTGIFNGFVANRVLKIKYLNN